MDLKNVNLLSLQTSRMKQDTTTQALCAALEQQFKQLADEVKACLIYSRVGELDEEALNELAWQLNVDFWDVSLAVEKKRALIKGSLKWHRIKGTPAAVEEMVSAAFDESTIQEWFEYGGDPYKFKITTTDRITDAAMLENLIRAVNSVKRKSSFMDGIYIQRENQINNYFTGVLHTGKKQTVNPDYSLQGKKVDAYFGGVVHVFTTYTIKP
jgi:phage tail P2-like protein